MVAHLWMMSSLDLLRFVALTRMLHGFPGAAGSPRLCVVEQLKIWQPRLCYNRTASGALPGGAEPGCCLLLSSNGYLL